METGKIGDLGPVAPYYSQFEAQLSHGGVNIGAQGRADVIMGAVGALAPTLFKVLGASTHTFWQIFLLHTSKEKKWCQK